MITCKGGQLCKEWELLGAQDRRSLQPWINEGQGLAEPFVPHCAEDFGELCQLFRFFHLNDWDARVYEQAGNKSYILEYLRWATSWLYKLRLNLFTLECTSIDLVRKDPLYQHFCLFIPPSTCAVILQSLRITSTVSVQFRTKIYYTSVTPVTHKHFYSIITTRDHSLSCITHHEIWQFECCLMEAIFDKDINFCAVLVFQ